MLTQVNKAFIKIVSGSESRRSRLHDLKGNFALRTASDIADCMFSLATCLVRVSTGYRVRRPWIASNAFRFLQRRIGNETRVFEWGSGMSTLWFSSNCREVHSVEDNASWIHFLRSRAESAKFYCLAGDPYFRKIHEFPPGYFDVIIVDGRQRLCCFQAAHQHLKIGGLLVIDNTDRHQETRGDEYHINRLLTGSISYKVLRFTGWAPGLFFPQETTVCIRLR